MGWIIDDGTDEASRHEGQAGYLVTAPWGELVMSGSSTGAGVLVPRLTADAAVARAFAGRDDDPYQVVPWSEVAGWQAACDCGWRGPEWAIDDVTLRLTENFDASDALLTGGGTVEDAALAAWREHVRPIQERAGRVEGIEAAANRYWQARHDLDLAVDAAREEPAISWADIGVAAGMTRQSAHERWSRRRRALSELPAETEVVAAAGTMPPGL